MPLFTNDNGTLRELKEMYVNDGGTLRELKEMYVNDNGTLRKVFASTQIVWTTSPWSLVDFRSPTARISIRMDNNGTGSAFDFAGATEAFEDWHVDAPSPPNAGDFETQVTWDVAPDSGPTGFVSLGSDTTWVWSTVTVKNVNGTITVRKIGDPASAVVKPFSITLEAV